MPKTKILNRAGKISSYARFGLLPAEFELIAKASALDERSLGDYCRIASVRAARLRLAEHAVTETDAFIDKIRKITDNELPFKE